ncbi:hypothetical protein GIB67_022040 [Kingdonia uniflora]|uniref:Glucosidase II beta subunit N-terminal domain-containing protein n=1 Tax=Kingdonia uniflora TaxID=39325 RepID=A0A7J7MU87_9MAGN|nr:hypothetical protein GIB67_022040 [Kingdonia uniflora]
METSRKFGLLLLYLMIMCSYSLAIIMRGVHPKDEEYFGSDLIRCKDGSITFSRDRLNDGFCDCADGTDEPGTSACPEGKFYCRNEGSVPKLLFSSRVNDYICDCCDGSDEYDSNISCQNTCFQNGNNNMTRTFSSEVIARDKEDRVTLEELVERLRELKIVFFLEVILCVLVLYFLRWRIIFKRRGYL